MSLYLHEFVPFQRDEEEREEEAEEENMEDQLVNVASQSSAEDSENESAFDAVDEELVLTLLPKSEEGGMFSTLHGHSRHE